MNAHVIDAKEMANNKKTTVDLEKQRWEESEDVIVYEDEQPEILKGAKWGDTVREGKQTVIVVDEYFPSLGDEGK